MLSEKGHVSEVVKTQAPSLKGDAGRTSNSIENLSIERRQFVFSGLSLGWIAFAGAVAAIFSTCMQWLFPSALNHPEKALRAGKVDDYQIGKVDLRWQEKYGVWIVRTLDSLYALSATSPDWGCKPQWFEQEQKFHCHCHGRSYYKSGVGFEGPTSKSLERYRVVLAKDGQILVDRTKTFRQEKGEWGQAESFLAL